MDELDTAGAAVRSPAPERTVLTMAPYQRTPPCTAPAEPGLSPKPGLDDGLGEVPGVLRVLRLLRLAPGPGLDGDGDLHDPKPVAHPFDQELRGPELVLVQPELPEDVGFRG